MSNEQDVLAVTGSVIGGKYQIERVLGQGGMGAVYAAENVYLRAPVAIKVLRPEVAEKAEFTARFVQEAQAAAQVRHPNVVSVLDFGVDEASGLLYLVQEFLTGEDLKQHLRRTGPLEPRAALELLMPIMRALAYAHSRGVVHRDLKPANIFLCQTPEGVVPKLIDFGIAKVIDAAGRSAQDTGSMVVMGTPQYMSPEQAQGGRSIDHRTDVWAMGVLLYHALTGRFPYEGATAQAIVGAILYTDPVRIETYAPLLPPDVTALVHGALCRDIARRVQTMDALWEAARRCSITVSETQPVGVWAPPVVPPVVQAPREDTPDTGSPQVTTVRHRRAAWRHVGAAVASLALVLVGVGAALRLAAVPATDVPPRASPTPPPSHDAGSPTAPRPDVQREGAPRVLPQVSSAPVDAGTAPGVGAHVESGVAGREPGGRRGHSTGSRPSRRANVIY